jgi:NADH:ubiquinone reductase (H+-translocating)
MVQRHSGLSQTLGLARLACMKDHCIIVAGAGYAGVSCALRLARRVPSNVSVTLVSATDRFVERIRLHQRATGQNVGDWSLPALIRRSGVELRVGVIEQMDVGNRTLKLGSDRVEFDTVVLALGSHIDVDSVKGVCEHAMAVEFGAVAGIHQALRKAATQEGRVTIVGGGLTGIELASEIAEVFPDLQVSLVSQTRLAETWSEAARTHVLGSMRRFGVRVEEGPHINSQGQALVDAQLRSVSHPGVHVVGDLAAIAPELTPQMPVGCKSAMPAGAWAAENIARRLRGQSEQSLQYAVPFFCVPGPARRAHSNGGPRRVDDRPRADRSPRRLVQGAHLPQHDVGAEDGAHGYVRHPVGTQSPGVRDRGTAGELTLQFSRGHSGENWK